MGTKDTSIWTNITARQPELHGDPEGTEQVVSRFSGKYLQALLRATTPQEADRVWLSFWHYLTARPTIRKPVALSETAADDLIVEFKSVLSYKGAHDQQ